MFYASTTNVETFPHQSLIVAESCSASIIKEYFSPEFLNLQYLKKYQLLLHNPIFFNSSTK
jgi:hypothetical protein